MTQHNHHHQDHQAHGEQPPHPRTGAEGDVHAGHDKHAGHSVASFRDKFWLTLLLTIPNQLGVDYNAHVIESILKHVAPALGWR